MPSMVINGDIAPSTVSDNISAVDSGNQKSPIVNPWREISKKVPKYEMFFLYLFHSDIQGVPEKTLHFYHPQF